MNWEAVREEFPALAHWTCLNSATYGQVPRRAFEAEARHWERRNEGGSADFLDWYDDANRLRGSLARLIHAAQEDIAFVPNAATGLSMVLGALKPGENVVIFEDEFPNYQYVTAARRASWDGFYDAIDAQTRLVAISEVNYATGFRPPLAEVSREVAKRGVPLFVDGSQSVGALTFDVTKTPVDVLAVHGYKWMMCPTGAAFVYISPEMRRKVAPGIVGWRSHLDWRNVDRLHLGTPQFSESAEKYEGGGLAFSLLYAMEAVVDWLLEIGPDRIEQRVLALAAETREMLRKLGATAAETGSQIVTATFPKADASQLARALKERRVLVSARHGALRVSPHFFNNQADIGRLRDSLVALL